MISDTGTNLAGLLSAAAGVSLESASDVVLDRRLRAFALVRGFRGVQFPCMPRQRGPHRRFFDLWSHFYDAPLVQRLTYQPEHDAVMRGLRRARTARVLDVGCGTGLLSARIQRELPDTVVVGCDFSPGMLAQATGNAPKARLVQGSAVALPFAAASFDAVVSTEAFHWFPDQDAALREFFRVLLPGGRLLVSLINPPFALVGRVGSRISRFVGEPARWPTRGRMRRQVEDAGFHVESQRIVLRLPATFVMPSVLTIASRAPSTPTRGTRRRPAHGLPASRVDRSGLHPESIEAVEP